MELQLVVALELRLELLAEFRLTVEARYPVLILVGQELEVVAGDGLGQPQICLLYNSDAADDLTRFAMRLRLSSMK
ncbi:hypothetical protein OEZ79_26695, partial [Leclercia adecarboxylata]